MELIQIDDFREQIIELKKLIRIVDSGANATLTENM